MVVARGIALLAVLAVYSTCSFSTNHGATSPLPVASLQRTLEPGAVHRYAVALKRGESCALVVTQRGVDVVVEVFGPDRARLLAVDSPNGREGDEPAEIVAGADGDHVLVVRALDARDTGRYVLTVAARRDAERTRSVLAERERERRAAVAWLSARSGAIQLTAGRLTGPGLERFDDIARRSRVVGIGEATHGSRQLADLRVALARRLVEGHGVRLIALEASAARMQLVDAWARGGGDLDALLGRSWINRRAFAALATYVRTWNTAHPTDPVTLVGLDDQDHGPAREVLARYARGMLDSTLADRVDVVLARLAQADAHAIAFQPSDVTADDWRFLVELVSNLTARSPPPVEAIAAARTLTQFAEFNAGGPRSRDWMMAENLMRVLGPDTRAAYLAHNAHVAHPPGQTGARAPAGGRLAATLGRDYAAIATSFEAGSVLAQRAGDPQGLQTVAVPRARAGSIDAALAALGDAIATWPGGGTDAPPWLHAPHPMHWIGATFASGDLATRDTRLVADYDGAVVVLRVDAEPPPW